jgi:hypothetical protein
LDLASLLFRLGFPFQLFDTGELFKKMQGRCVDAYAAVTSQLKFFNAGAQRVAAFCFQAGVAPPSMAIKRHGADNERQQQSQGKPRKQPRNEPHPARQS